MASLTKAQMDVFVLGFAQSCNLFQSPTSLLDPVKPLCNGMSANELGAVVAQLVQAATAAGITTNVLAGDLTRAAIWDDVSLSLFGHQ